MALLAFAAFFLPDGSSRFTMLAIAALPQSRVTGRGFHF